MPSRSFERRRRPGNPGRAASPPFSGPAEAHRADLPQSSPGFIDRHSKLPWLHEPAEHEFPAFVIMEDIDIIFARDAAPLLSQYFKQGLPDLLLAFHIKISPDSQIRKNNCNYPLVIVLITMLRLGNAFKN
jgi:hypothetical protein